MKKLKSLTIFFPFYNDEGTVKKQISDAYRLGKMSAQKIEVIAIHGGKSKDNTLKEIQKQKLVHPDLIIEDKKDNNEGYAVIKTGFNKAGNDWVFYTDGDAQYHLDDLSKLVEKHFKSNADVINGYKTYRKDELLRKIFGNIYRILCKILFKLPIRDINCDFRLIRRKLLEELNLESRSAMILPELIKKLQLNGASFAEVKVKHYPRIWGRSNLNLVKFTLSQIMGLFRLYFSLKKLCQREDSNL